jgi:hypothetical protein
MKYKITNPLEQRVRCGKYLFEAKETKIMDIIPGVGFIIEEIEENEKPTKQKGGK